MGYRIEVLGCSVQGLGFTGLGPRFDFSVHYDADKNERCFTFKELKSHWRVLPEKVSDGSAL